MNGRERRRPLRLEIPETKQIGQAVETPPLTPRKGAIQHYMLFRVSVVDLTMNDKGGDFKGSMQHFT